MSELDNTEYQEHEIKLNKDEEFLSYCHGMTDEYKFTKEDLLEFVSRIIHSAGFHAFLERASYEMGFDYNREGQLDSDLMGCYGIKMAAEQISELTTNDEGYSYVVKEEDD